MTAIREVRCAAALSQRQCADLLCVPVKYYKKSFSRFAFRPPFPITRIPVDYDRQLRRLRRDLRLTQSEFAVRIGAAGKAVVYQWESRRRQPSIVFWHRVISLRVKK